MRIPQSTPAILAMAFLGLIASPGFGQSPLRSPAVSTDTARAGAEPQPAPQTCRPELRTLPRWNEGGGEIASPAGQTAVAVRGQFVSTRQEPVGTGLRGTQDPAPALPGAADEPEPRPSAGRTDRGQSAPAGLRPIQEIQLSVFPAAGANIPKDRSEALFTGHAGPASEAGLPLALCHWEPPCISYRRLYFEDPLLERYGKCRGPVQDVIRSGGQFSSALILWPLRGALDMPGQCESPLGFCRPGNEVPCYHDRLIDR